MNFSRLRYSAIILVIANASVLFWLFGSQRQFFLNASIFYFGFIGFLVTVVEVVLLGIVWKIVPHRILVSAVITGAFTAINIGYFLLPVLNLRNIGLKAVFLLIGFLCGFSYVRWKAVQGPIVVFLALFALQAWADPEAFYKKEGITTVSLPAQQAMAINLKRAHRNIYLLELDAFISDEAFTNLFAQYSSLRELPWKAALIDEGMKHYELAYSAASRSDPSFLRTLSFGVSQKVDTFHFFGGAFPVPAYSVARSAGMSRQWLSINSYFGIKSGEYVNYFFPETITGICDFFPKHFMGLACRDDVVRLANYLSFGNAIHTDSKISLISAITKRITVIQESSDKWLTVAYIWAPGHTTDPYDFRNSQDVSTYVARFDRESLEAAQIITTLVRTIKKVDPGSVIIVTGDHGAWLTAPDLGNLPKELVELDNRGVGFFVYPADTCSEVFGQYRYDLGLVLRDLFLCIKAKT